MKPGTSISFSVKWSYNINDYQKRMVVPDMNYLKRGNRIYVIAQFYPRMAVFNDVEGWQNMQFWEGEFAVPFGDDVNIRSCRSLWKQLES
jgi:hypothetical protein